MRTRWMAEPVMFRRSERFFTARELRAHPKFILWENYSLVE